MAHPAPPASAALRKEIRLHHAVALHVSSVLGSGALVLPGLTAQIAGPASLVAWVLLAVVVGDEVEVEFELVLVPVSGAPGRTATCLVPLLDEGDAGELDFVVCFESPRAPRVLRREPFVWPALSPAARGIESLVRTVVSGGTLSPPRPPLTAVAC